MNGPLEEAKRLLDEALDPETPDPWYRIGEARDALDRVDE